MSRRRFQDAENTSNAEFRSIATAEDYRTQDVRMEMKKADPTKVKCYGDGLKFGYINQPIEATIDTKNAGPGELCVYCNGATNSAFCELGDHHDGTFTLTIRAQDVGLHSLFVKYEGVDVPGSPFGMRVSPASLVEARGPGLHDAFVHKKYSAEFEVNTLRAGPGDLKIRVGGPRGGFRTQTQKQGWLLRCRFNPAVPGTYVINVLWNQDPIPNSPFRVRIFRNEKELRRSAQLQMAASNGTLQHLRH
ncbi:hypothetical protein CAPTEDRAFT_220637 [Capitella teleta]|uniref:Uncharacterized protein n=1 Tax=Capitella teleta TaxID=283909 RepID=R7TL30_CAPTE|nr:hypothetical protein CAPTEDRAFT_220637 [Capitella teleta]|eukprot:ELT91795.1 hypothetical protein CAPTEDRAFT_220637 [Capitella teleta]